MVIARQIKEKLSSTPAGVVLTTRDFGVEMRYQPALAKALNRLVLQGELQKIAKGKWMMMGKRQVDSESYATVPQEVILMLIFWHSVHTFASKTGQTGIDAQFQT